eukprot:3220137-Amphidinium_carterae.1
MDKEGKGRLDFKAFSAAMQNLGEASVATSADDPATPAPVYAEDSPLSWFKRPQAPHKRGTNGEKGLSEHARRRICCISLSCWM